MQQRQSGRVPKQTEFYGNPVSSNQSFGDGDDPESDEISISFDPNYSGKQLRLQWEVGKYESLRKAQTNYKGELECGICNQVIELDKYGREVYNPPDKYKNRTRPHIDHHGPDWKDRLKKLYQYPFKSDQDFKDAAEKMFNADPLRIAHKECNLKRNK